MANNLVKWWKNKFINGYRQFSGVTTNYSRHGHLSDMEELLQKDISVAGDNPPEKSTRTVSSQTIENSPGDNKQDPSMKFEKFSYDVSLEGGIDHDGQERQEFSFTLYDFDGHGKITKDDIAGLVTTIYETLGTSIKVPHYGSKTIRVRLTVSPGQKKNTTEEENSPKSKSEKIEKKPEKVNSTNSQFVRLKRDINVTIRKSRGVKRTKKKSKIISDEKICCNVSADNNDGAADISDDADEDPCSIYNSKDCTNSTQCPKNEEFNFKSYPRHEHVVRMRQLQKRSGSLQRQELLDIIQANMAKNDLSFHMSRRKQMSESVIINENKKFMRDIGKPAVHNPDVEHVYHTQPHDSPKAYCCYDGARINIMDDKKNLNDPGRRLHHKEGTHGIRELSEKDKRDHVTENIKYYVPPLDIEQPSPHLKKHKNRQEDQARAMAQVVRWLEQEFSCNLRMSAKGKWKNNARPAAANNQAWNDARKKKQHSVVEHRHVHQHIHHHYHHFQDAPVVI